MVDLRVINGRALDRPLSPPLRWVPVGYEFHDLTTKLGGQPFWAAKPRWPVTAPEDGSRPLRFILQVPFDEALLTYRGRATAYVFLNENADKAEDVIGRTRVVVTPTGRNRGPFIRQESGPTAYLDDPDDGDPSRRFANFVHLGESALQNDELSGPPCRLGQLLPPRDQMRASGRHAGWHVLLRLLPGDLPPSIELDTEAVDVLASPLLDSAIVARTSD